MDPCDAIALHEAYRAGDLDTIVKLLGDPPDFPNCRGPRGMGEIILEYAIYHSPFALIEKLLEMGADPDYGDHAGFPSIIAALSSARADRLEIMDLLLRHGADIQQRGLNGYTPLHWAAGEDDPALIAWLLKRGADPEARTDVDDHATPLEEAVILGREKAAQALRDAPARNRDE